jgi:hypothetical protein
MFRRESWLHVLLSATSPQQSAPSSLDQVLSVQAKADEVDVSALANNAMQGWFVQHLRCSSMNTFSREEVSTFAGFLSEDEESLMCHLAAKVNCQHLSACDITSTESGREPFVPYAPLLSFLKRTEELLSIGGDDRLSIDFLNGKINKYLSSTVPRPNLINRSSCTCSTASIENYLLADSVRRFFLRTVIGELIKQAEPTAEHTRAAIRQVFAAMQGQLFSRVQHTLRLTGSGAELVLFPSGSDAEYLPLVAGLVRSHMLVGGDVTHIKVFNYVCAAGEVGR